MMKIVIGILCGLIVLGAALLWMRRRIPVSDPEDGRCGMPERRMNPKPVPQIRRREPCAMSEKNNRTDVCGSVEACWTLFRQVEAAEKRFQARRRIFCEEGVFYYLQRFAAYVRMVRCGVPFAAEKELFRYWFVNNLRNLLTARGRCLDDKADNSGAFEPEIDRQHFLLGLGIRDEAHCSAGEIRLLEGQCERLRMRLQEIEALPNNRLFRALWDELQPVFAELFAFDRERLDTIGDRQTLCVETERLFGRLEEVLDRHGIRFRFAAESSAEEIDRAFLLADEGEELPAVIRSADGHLYLKGTHVEHSMHPTYGKDE